MASIIEWVDEDLWNLLNLPNQELYRLYSAYLDQGSIRRTANKYRRLHRVGDLTMPERQKPYNPETEGLEIANRRARASKNLGAKAVETTVLTIPAEHLSYHQKLQEALDDKGAVDRARFSEYQMGYKDADGEAQVQDLKAVRFEVKFDHEPQWPLVTRVESKRLPRRESEPRTSSRRAVILSDLQIPYQDEKAVEVALKILRDAKPDKVILLGDMLDLAPYGKFINEPEWASGVQDAIIRAHQLLVTLRQMCPTAEIAVLEGNHDARLPKDMKVNSAKSLRLKRADQLDGWPVMSVPYLTAMDSLDVQYLAGYPANRYWINDNLQVRHGQRVTSAGSTAKLVSDDERVSTIFGHVHRIESHMKTVQTRSGGKTSGAYSIGCLCRIDGSVPSTKSGYDLDGTPIENYENWQSGFAVVDYEDGDSPFHVQTIYINSFNNHRAIWNGRLYESA